jgi:hypothetical protein
LAIGVDPEDGEVLLEEEVFEELPHAARAREAATIGRIILRVRIGARL